MQAFVDLSYCDILRFRLHFHCILINGNSDWCQKNSTAVVAYSPLGQGFLTGAYKSIINFEEDVFRLLEPRFSE